MDVYSCICIFTTHTQVPGLFPQCSSSFDKKRKTKHLKGIIHFMLVMGVSKPHFVESVQVLRVASLFLYLLCGQIGVAGRGGPCAGSPGGGPTSCLSHPLTSRQRQTGSPHTCLQTLKPALPPRRAQLVSEPSKRWPACPQVGYRATF